MGTSTRPTAAVLFVLATVMAALGTVFFANNGLRFPGVALLFVTLLLLVLGGYAVGRSE